MENPVVVKTSQVKKGGVWFSIRHFCTGAAVAAFRWSGEYHNRCTCGRRASSTCTAGNV